jgi:magnesium chelatase subunit I
MAAAVDGVRADLVMLRAARALAAFEGRSIVSTDDVDAVAELALAHRRLGEASASASAPSSATTSSNAPRPHASTDARTPSDFRQPTAASPASEGDWGALPPQPEPTSRVTSTGGFPSKKA